MALNILLRITVLREDPHILMLGTKPKTRAVSSLKRNTASRLKVIKGVILCSMGYR